MSSYQRSSFVLALCTVAVGLAQQTPTAPSPDGTAGGTSRIQPGQTQEPVDKRVFGVLPNYRTANESAVYTPIPAKQKFTIAAKDSFDYPLLMLGAVYGGLGQLTDQHPAFGQGLAGFGRRFGTGYADQAIGNMMTEGFFPTFLREDPRYFRRGHGPTRGRLWYALTRVIVTRTDSGGSRFNFSEWLGNGTAVAISNAYYPDEHAASDASLKLLEQVGTDAVSQVLKEFWPDIKRKLFHHGQSAEEGVH